MPMTNRERVLATYRHQPVDRVPDWEFGAWQQTIERWHEEGLPKEIDGTWEAINEHFRTDELGHGPSPRVNVGLLPGFEYQVLEEKGDHLIVQDGDGAIAEMIRPELGASIPRYLRHALETKADWEKIREERLNPDTPGRAPDDLEEVCRRSYDADYPVSTNAGSTYGWIRNWMGVENVSIAVAEDPEWVGEMIAHLTDLKLKMLEKLAGEVPRGDLRAGGRTCASTRGRWCHRGSSRSTWSRSTGGSPTSCGRSVAASSTCWTATATSTSWWGCGWRAGST